jgi:Fe-S-cluster containining protein
LKINEVLGITDFVEIALLPKVTHQFQFPEVTIEIVLTKGVRFECMGCGNCCFTDSPVPVTKREWKTLRKKKKEYPFVKKVHFSQGKIYDENLPTSHSGLRIKTKIMKRTIIGKEWRSPCLYLTKNSRCMIYNDRPLVCAIYPFHPHEESFMAYAIARKQEEDLRPAVKFLFYLENEENNYVCNGFQKGEMSSEELRPIAILLRTYVNQTYYYHLEIADKIQKDEALEKELYSVLTKMESDKELKKRKIIMEHVLKKGSFENEQKE